jgi:hypothetical protein
MAGRQRVAVGGGLGAHAREFYSSFAECLCRISSGPDYDHRKLSGLRMTPLKRNLNRYLVLFLLAGTLSYARSYVKNCIKVLIGRKPYFTHRNIFFRQYLAHLVGIRPICKVTCPGSIREGAGSQALLIMVTINFARLYGLIYVHTPFQIIKHADRPVSEWIEAWEAHFNLGLGERSAAGDDHEIINFSYNHVELLPLLDIDGINLYRMFEMTIPEFRRKYYSNKSQRKNEILTICVHVRRGDVTPNGHPDWTSTSFIAETMSRVRMALDNHDVKYKICIISQREFTDVAELNVPDAELFIDVDPIWCMREAIEADILIMAKSCFSYVAALISDGIKIYEPWHLPPLNGWIIRDSNGGFDGAHFERQLTQHIEIHND